MGCFRAAVLFVGHLDRGINIAHGQTIIRTAQSGSIQNAAVAHTKRDTADHTIIKGRIVYASAENACGAAIGCRAHDDSVKLAVGISLGLTATCSNDAADTRRLAIARI